MRKMIVLISALFFILASIALAADDSQKAKFTKSELLEHIRGTLDFNDEVLNFIQDLNKEKDETGKNIYKYKGTDIEKMDADDLQKLSNGIQNELARIRIERLNKQMESIRQAQQANAAAQQAARAVVPATLPQRPPMPPQMQNVPQPPKAPPTPPKR